MLEFYLYSNKMLKKNNVSVVFFTNLHYGKLFYITFATFMNWTVRGVNNPRELETFHENRSSRVILLCPQCHMISNHKVQRINTSLVISNHSRKKTAVGPPNFISHSVFYWKIHLVLDRDTFRLELDYRSIMHILVKVPSN
jgi:hypothetical protein